MVVAIRPCYVGRRPAPSLLGGGRRQGRRSSAPRQPSRSAVTLLAGCNANRKPERCRPGFGLRGSNPSGSATTSVAVDGAWWPCRGAGARHRSGPRLWREAGVGVVGLIEAGPPVFTLCARARWRAGAGARPHTGGHGGPWRRPAHACVDGEVADGFDLRWMRCWRLRACSRPAGQAGRRGAARAS